MSDSVLLQLLSLGLIDVRGDDSKLEKLEAAATDVAAILKKEPGKTISFTIVACDPSVETTDAAVLSVVEILKSRWPTYVNTFSGTPIAVIRAILLQGLVLAANRDDRIGVALVNTARNILPLSDAGAEQAVWIDVISAIETKVDERSEAEWATPDEITIDPMSFEPPEPTTPKVNRQRVGKDSLRTAMRAAGGPHYHTPNGNVATDGNPYWPQNPSQWNTEFGERMAVAIATAIDGVIEKISVDLPDLSGPLTALAQGASQYVADAVQGVSAATSGLQRRTNLLWWKESLYSPSARTGYRTLPPAAASALMAFDLHCLVPTFSPASVSSFLYEAVVGLPNSDPQAEVRILDLVAEVRGNPGLKALREMPAAVGDAASGRGSVISFMSAGSTLEGFELYTGVSSEAKFTLPVWSAWIFRELQASRAAVEASKGTRRARKV